MPNKIYVSKNTGAGNPAVWEQAGVSLKKLGDDIPGSMESFTGSAGSPEPNPLNRTIEFEGDIYTAHDSKVYKLSGSGTWDLDYTASVAVASNTEGMVGLYTALVGDKSYLYMIWKGSTEMRMVRKTSAINDTGAWGSEITYTPTLTAGMGNAGTHLVFAVQFNNVVYCRFVAEQSNNWSPLILANLETNAITEAPEPVFPPSEANVNANNWIFCGDIAPLNKKIYYTLSSSRDVTGKKLKENYLFEVEGGIVREAAFINRCQEKSDTANGFEVPLNTNFEHRDGLFPKGNSLYAIVWATGANTPVPTNVSSDTETNDGWAMYKLTPSGSTFLKQEVTDTVLPASLRRAATTGISVSPSWNGKWHITNQIDASGNERTWVYFSNRGLDGSIVNLYEFIDDSTELELVDIGSNVRLAPPAYKTGGGQREPAPIQAFIKDVREGTNAGTVDVDVRIIGSGQSILMGILYSSEQKTPTSLMNFSATTSGVLISSNTIVSGLVAATGDLFTVTWEAENQGVPYAVKTLMNPIITLL